MKKLFLFALLSLNLHATNTAFIVKSGVGSSGSPVSWSNSGASTFTASARVLTLSITSVNNCTTGTSTTFTDGVLTNGGPSGNDRATFSYVCTTGQLPTSITLTWKGSGYTSAPTTCSATNFSCTSATVSATITSSLSSAPGDGDFVGTDCPASFSYVQIDQNIGSVAGGGIGMIQVCKWQLTVKAGGRYTIVFASTGTAPQGNGPNHWQPGTTATQFGFFFGASGLSTYTTLDTSAGAAPYILPSNATEQAQTGASAYISAVSVGSTTTFTCTSTCPSDLVTGQGIGLVDATTSGWSSVMQKMYIITANTSNSFTIPLNSTGNSTNWNGRIYVPTLAITTADGASPIYFYRDQVYVNNFGVNLNLVGIGVNSCGSSSGWDCFFTNPLTTSSSHHDTYTWKNSFAFAYSRFNITPNSGYFQDVTMQNASLFNSSTTTGIEFGNSNMGGGTWSVSDVTDSSPGVTSHYFFNPPWQASTFTMNRVAAIASASNSAFAYSLHAGAGTAAGGLVGTDIACLAPAGVTFSGVNGCISSTPSSGNTDTIDGLITDLEFLLIDSAASGVSGSQGSSYISNVWNRLYNSGAAQGSVAQWSGQNLYMRNVTMYASNAFGFPFYIIQQQASTTPNQTFQLDGWVGDMNNQVVSAFIRNSEESTSNPSFNNAYRSGMLTGQSGTQGFGVLGISDCANVSATCGLTTFVADSLGSGVSVGLHHNLAYNPKSINYVHGNVSGVNGSLTTSGSTSQPGPAIHWDDGTHIHGCNLKVSFTGGASGWTNGTYILAWSGGTYTTAPVISVTVTAGAVASAFVQACGANVSVLPTSWSLPTAAGSGAAVTFTVTGDTTTTLSDYLYGDLTNSVQPQYTNQTATPALFDAWFLGGPGTLADLQSQLSTRWVQGIGIGCTVCAPFTNGAFGISNDNVLRAMLKFLQRGHISNAPQTFQSGWNGGQVSSLPGTCTPGIANDVVWLVNGSSSQIGRYRCTATNTWTHEQPVDIGSSTIPIVQRIPF